MHFANERKDQLLHNVKIVPERIRSATVGIKVKILFEIVWNGKLNAFSNSIQPSFLNF